MENKKELNTNVTEEALQFLIDFFSAELDVCEIDKNETEYSLSGYVITKEQFDLLLKAGVPVKDRSEYL